MGKAFSCEVEARSSTAARLRKPLPMSPLANVQVRGAATHRAPGRWLWQSRPAVQLSTGRRALGRVAKQPVLSSDHEGADSAFSGVIVERQVAFLDVSLQLASAT